MYLFPERIELLISVPSFSPETSSDYPYCLTSSHKANGKHVTADYGKQVVALLSRAAMLGVSGGNTIRIQPRPSGKLKTHAVLFDVLLILVGIPFEVHASMYFVHTNCQYIKARQMSTCFAGQSGALSRFLRKQ